MRFFSFNLSSKTIAKISFILATLSFFCKYILAHFGINLDWVLDPAFTFFLIIAISVYFDNKTKEELFRKLDEYLQKIAVPNFEEVRSPIKEFMAHLNSSSLPYEKERNVIMNFIPDKEENLLRITTIYQVEYDKKHLRKLSQMEANVSKSFTLCFPEQEVKDIIGQSDEEIYKFLGRKTFVIFGNSELSIEEIKQKKQTTLELLKLELLKEEWERKNNFILYSFAISIPIKDLLKLPIPLLKIKIAHLYDYRDTDLTIFRTFCRLFRLQLYFDKSLNIEDVKQHIQILPISYNIKNPKNSEKMGNIENSQTAILSPLPGKT